jgi:hypothetical protein
MYGYAKYIFWLWLMKPRLDSELPWFPICPILGNAPPNKPPIPPVGKDTVAASRSLAVATDDVRPVRELFCTMTGNPQDIGTRWAFAGYARIANDRTTSNSITDLFTIFTTLLLIIVIMSFD